MKVLSSSNWKLERSYLFNNRIRERPCLFEKNDENILLYLRAVAQLISEYTFDSSYTEFIIVNQNIVETKY